MLKGFANLFFFSIALTFSRKNQAAVLRVPPTPTPPHPQPQCLVKELKPYVMMLAEMAGLFCSVAPIHEIDVTLLLSVYTHTQRGQRVASFNKNKPDSLLDVTSPVL